jgi:hypothetical protein
MLNKAVMPQFLKLTVRKRKRKRCGPKLGTSLHE